jgi:(2Fe-2S) ferredoxin
MPVHDKYIFICENMRDPGHPKGCCGLKGGSALKKSLKQLLVHYDLNETCRANTAGCLDVCEHGAAMVIYPQGIWYGHVKETDLPEIIEQTLQKNKIIDRLLIKDDL